MRGVPNGAVLADEEDEGIEDLPAGGVFDGMLGGTDDDNSTKRKRRSAVVRASAMAAFFERPTAALEPDRRSRRVQPASP